MSLRTKMLAVFSSIIIIGLGLLVAISMVNIKNTTKSSMNDRLQDMTDDRAVVVESFIDSYKQFFKAFSTQDIVKEALHHPEDKELQAELQKNLIHYIEARGDMEGMFVADSATKVIAHSVESAIGNPTIADEAVVQTVTEAIKKSEDHSYFRGIVVSSATGKLVVSVYVGVFDGDDLIGLIGGGCYAEGISNILSGMKMTGLEHSKANLYYVPKYTYILSADESLIGTEVSESGVKSLIDAIVSKGEGVEEYHNGVENNFLAYKFIPEYDLAFTVEETEKEAMNDVNWLMSVILFMSVVILVAILVVVIMFAMRISKDIGKVQVFAEKLSEGNFTIDNLFIKRKDEIGKMADSLNRMYENNANVIRNIGEGSGKVSVSSGMLSETSTDLMARFEEVRASMERVNEAMTSAGAATEQVSASANEVNDSVERLAIETKNTKMEVVEIQKKAAEIERDGRKSSEYAMSVAEARGKELEAATEEAKVVSEIATMADSIADIASKINLLSLNASIEAARAGEHGRGFAVVAGEINSLASQTKEAVDQIQATVDKIQQAFEDLQRSSSELLSFMRETVAPDYRKFITIGRSYGEDASKFGELADNISSMVQYISESMEQVNAAVADIAESATETAGSSSSVTDTISEASGMMEQVNDMATDQQDIATNLDSIVKQFKLDD